ncbi:zinc-binding dehydrogenase domain-containing protein [Trichoderma evansii]
MVGARVIGTASSEESFELLRSFGVDQIIDYKKDKPDEVLENVDIVFDSVGGETAKQALNVLKKDGLLISIKDREFFGYDEGPEQKMIFFFVDMDAEQLTKIRNLIDEGKLRPVVDSVYDFEDVREAFKAGETGHAHGKIVLRGPKA